MRQIEMILRSRIADINIYADTLTDANTAIREYVSVFCGGLTEAELLNADEWSWRWFDRDGDEEIEVLRGWPLSEEDGGGIVYEVTETVPLEAYL